MKFLKGWSLIGLMCLLVGPVFGEELGIPKITLLDNILTIDFTHKKVTHVEVSGDKPITVDIYHTWDTNSRDGKAGEIKSALENLGIGDIELADTRFVQKTGRSSNIIRFKINSPEGKRKDRQLRENNMALKIEVNKPDKWSSLLRSNGLFLVAFKNAPNDFPFQLLFDQRHRIEQFQAGTEQTPPIYNLYYRAEDGKPLNGDPIEQNYNRILAGNTRNWFTYKDDKNTITFIPKTPIKAPGGCDLKYMSKNIAPITAFEGKEVGFWTFFEIYLSPEPTLLLTKKVSDKKLDFVFVIEAPTKTSKKLSFHANKRVFQVIGDYPGALNMSPFNKIFEKTDQPGYYRSSISKDTLKDLGSIYSDLLKENRWKLTIEEEGSTNGSIPTMIKITRLNDTFRISKSDNWKKGLHPDTYNKLEKAAFQLSQPLDLSADNFWKNEESKYTYYIKITGDSPDFTYEMDERELNTTYRPDGITIQSKTIPSMLAELKSREESDRLKLFKLEPEIPTNGPNLYIKMNPLQLPIKKGPGLRLTSFQTLLDKPARLGNHKEKLCRNGDEYYLQGPLTQTLADFKADNYQFTFHKETFEYIVTEEPSNTDRNPQSQTPDGTVTVGTVIPPPIDKVVTTHGIKPRIKLKEFPFMGKLQQVGLPIGISLLRSDNDQKITPGVDPSTNNTLISPFGLAGDASLTRDALFKWAQANLNWHTGQASDYVLELFDADNKSDPPELNYYLRNKKNRVLFVYNPLMYGSSYRQLIMEKYGVEEAPYIINDIDTGLNLFLAAMAQPERYNEVWVRLGEDDPSGTRQLLFKYREGQHLNQHLGNSPAYYENYTWTDSVILQDHEKMFKHTTDYVDIVLLGTYRNTTDIHNRLASLGKVRICLFNFTNSSPIPSPSSNIKVVHVRIDDQLEQKTRRLFDPQDIFKFFTTEEAPE